MCLKFSNSDNLNITLRYSNADVKPPKNDTFLKSFIIDDEDPKDIDHCDVLDDLRDVLPNGRNFVTMTADYEAFTANCTFVYDLVAVPETSHESGKFTIPFKIKQKQKKQNKTNKKGIIVNRCTNRH